MLIALLWLPIISISRLLERSWFSPGAVLSLVLGISALGTAIFAPEYHQSYVANLYLQLLALIVSVCVVVGRSLPGTYRPPAGLTVSSKPAFLLIGYASALTSFVITLDVLGVSLRELANPLSIARTVQAATRTRYIEGLDFPLIYNLANAVLIAYAAVSVIHMIASKALSLNMSVPIVVFIASNLLITTRAPIILLMITTGFAALYSLKWLSPGQDFPRLFTKRSWPAILLGTVALLALFFGFQMLRFGEESTRTFAEIWDHLRRWPWGSLPGFSLWWDGLAPIEASIHLPGFYTFMGIFDNLGIEERVVGGYSGYVMLAPGEAANVYTAYRGLIHDFGYIGSIVVMATLGLVGGVATAGKFFPPLLSLALYVAITSFMAFSFVTSYWSFTSNILGITLIPVFMRLFMQHMHPVATVGFKEQSCQR